MDTQEYTETINELTSINEGRAGFYRMLAQIYFKELTQAQLEHLSELDFSGFSGDDETIAEGYEDIRHYLCRINTGTRQELACDYAHTFLAAGNYDSFAATPYESVFISELGLLMQESRDEVYKTYCEAHIQPEESLRTPEDHVSFEFEYIATMIERTNEALAKSDISQAAECAAAVSRFHKEHQLNWIDDLCDAIMDVAETRFYRGVSKITRGFVNLESDVIADEVDVLEELRVAKAA